MRLRCRTKEGKQIVLDGLTEDSTLGELADKVDAGIGGVEAHSELVLKAGYPPKLLDQSDTARTLRELELQSGETLIAETKPRANWLREKASQLDSVLSSQGGFLTRYTIPANNSCLFLAIDFCLGSKTEVNLDAASPLRLAIANAVSSNPTKYNEAFLEQANSAYAAWIQLPETWGGAIELSILCAHFGVEIDVVDAQTGRIDQYKPEEASATQRIFLIYDGIHYDALAMENPTDGQLQTRFSVDDEQVYRLASELGQEAKAAKQFTDVNKFQLKCIDCDVLLRGEREARQHAKQTQHCNFGETR